MQKARVTKTKHSCTVISIPPSGCIDLNVYYGGREICWAIMQMLSNSAKAWQISPSRKPALNYSVRVSSVEMTTSVLMIS